MAVQRTLRVAALGQGLSLGAAEMLWHVNNRPAACLTGEQGEQGEQGEHYVNRSDDGGVWLAMAGATRCRAFGEVFYGAPNVQNVVRTTGSTHHPTRTLMSVVGSPTIGDLRYIPACDRS